MRRNPLLEAIASGQIWIEGYSPPRSIIQNKSIPTGVRRSFISEVENRPLHIAVEDSLPCVEYCVSVDGPCIVSAASCLVESQSWDREVVEVFTPLVLESVVVNQQSINVDKIIAREYVGQFDVDDSKAVYCIDIHDIVNAIGFCHQLIVSLKKNQKNAKVLRHSNTTNAQEN